MGLRADMGNGPGDDLALLPDSKYQQIIEGGRR